MFKQTVRVVLLVVSLAYPCLTAPHQHALKGGNFDAQDSEARSKATPPAQPVLTSAGETPGDAAEDQHTSSGNDGRGMTTRAFVVVIDTSKSIVKTFREMTDVGKYLIQSAPAGVTVGVVGIDMEARKDIFANRADALAFIDSLKPKGDYTDFNRGVDAAINLVNLARAERAAIILLTDGQQDVPKAFRDRTDFLHILDREFRGRPEIRVFVLNVNGRKTGEGPNLPANITVISLNDWREALRISEPILVPQLKVHLVGTSETSPTGNNSPVESQPLKEHVKHFWVWGLGASAIVLLALAAWLYTRKRKHSRRTESVLPANVMHQDDLKPASVRPSPAAVAIIDIEKEPASLGGERPVRVALRRDEGVTLGGAIYEASQCLEGLKQSRTLELRFDGKMVTGFRLRPDTIGICDQVTLEGRNAPTTFVLDRDTCLGVGDYRVMIRFADESYLESLLPSRDQFIHSMPLSASRRTLRGNTPHKY